MDAYIIGGYRSAVAKAPRGGFRFLRADDLGEQVIRRLMSDFPQLDKERIDLCGIDLSQPAVLLQFAGWLLTKPRCSSRSGELRQPMCC